MEELSPSISFFHCPSEPSLQLPLHPGSHLRIYIAQLSLQILVLMCSKLGEDANEVKHFVLKCGPLCSITTISQTKGTQIPLYHLQRIKLKGKRYLMSMVSSFSSPSPHFLIQKCFSVQSRYSFHTRVSLRRVLMWWKLPYSLECMEKNVSIFI